MSEKGQLSQKDLKRFKKSLEDSRKAIIENARKTMEEESNFDTDDLPDEIKNDIQHYAENYMANATGVVDVDVWLPERPEWL